ncbi:MAG: hypothetical protein WCQ03_08085 [Phycisphaerae bacterium]
MNQGARIVCVTDPLGPGTGSAMLAACAQAWRFLQDTVGLGLVEVGVLGTHVATQLAVENGLQPAWRIPLPCGNLRLAESALSRVFDASSAKVVVAWGARAAQLVSRCAHDTPVVVVLDAACESKSVLHAELAEVLCLGDSLADAASALGWLPIRIRAVSPTMPAWKQIPSIDRNSLRRQWGATDQDCVIGVLPLSVGCGDALFAFHAMGRFSYAGHGAHLVLDPSLGNANAVRSIARKLDLNDRVHFESSIVCPWKLSAGVDLWLSLRDPIHDQTALHHSCAAALGAPILAQSGSFAAAAIEHQVDGLVAGAGVNAYAFEMIHAATHPAMMADMALAARVRYASQSVRDRFALAVQEGISRVCPEALIVPDELNRIPAELKFSAAST